MHDDDPLAALRRTWTDEIPITAAMDVRPLRFEDHGLHVRATLAPNVNVHGTAFAGSLYAVAALSGWGLVHLELGAAELAGGIVIAEGGIEYLRPVQEDIEAVCRTDASSVRSVLAQLETAGRARWPLTATIDADGREAVRFEGVYAVRLRDR